jgi:hypothetical protein
MTDAYTELEVLICLCASDIIQNNGATPDMLITLHDALLKHLEEDEHENRTLH